ncbi:hypothetical protein B0H66DRAFT_47487 [Apodospora peruviana]|uniref:Uncharacterized protein n=1 Tax=Apodospora peruviana TaxID=516989 RepID=A0AAE0MF40_9PEZI|nr:hypothetical protein B0H66DRAFT_47487 [Apodospora peruviana]
MLRRSSPIGPGSQPCQVCGLIYRQQTVYSAKRPFVTLDAGRRLAKLSQAQARPSSPIQTRLFFTSTSSLKGKRTAGSNLNAPRFLKRTGPSASAALDASDAPKLAREKEQLPDPVSISDLAAAVDRVTKAFLAQPGIPSEHMTLTALQACTQASGKLAHVSPLRSPETESTDLLDLDNNGRKAPAGPPVERTVSLHIQSVADQISDAAYEIVSHPAVVITPQVLSEYIGLQARLGRPETLPGVMELFSSKPTPRLVSGVLSYSPRNPDDPRNAISPSTAEVALNAAVAAKNMDAAVGILESTYGTKAWKRSKMITRALLPAGLVAAAPIGVWLLASNLATMQQSYDQATATKIAFAGIIAYLGFTGTIGLVAMTTANDHYRRVTWLTGTSMAERWLREEERAAYDKIACGFGFKDENKWGEEQAEDFLMLKEFIARKGMILDAVHLLPGME